MCSCRVSFCCINHKLDPINIFFLIMGNINLEVPEPEITTPKSDQKRKTTTYHMQEKKYGKILKTQLNGGAERILYSKLEKVFANS